MEKEKILNLHVKLVPAIDLETRMPYYAYTVYCTEESTILSASGCTLRDAVTLFRKLRHVDDRTKVRLVRPFRKQKLQAIPAEMFESII
jgi:hypothetical protein